ncbi:MAG: hypothetical protein ACERKD_15870 [Prolixibacteraceae bacterium]
MRIIQITRKIWELRMISRLFNVLKESFDTTIRDEKNLYYAIRYTLNSPVNAGLVNDWRQWEGTWCRPGCGFGCGVGCGDLQSP